MITKEDLLKITEAAVDANEIFSAWVTPEKAASAIAKWGPKASSQEGQKEILDAAANANKTGDYSAVDYLYSRYQNIIIKAFWKYLIGPNKKLGADKLQNGMAAEFSSTSYMMLAGASDISPYNTFNPDVFDSEADLLNQFGWYYYRYLQNEAFKIIRANNKGGFSGNRDVQSAEDAGAESVDPSVTSYDDFYQNSKEASTEDFSDSTNLNLIFNEFAEWLRSEKGERYYQVFSMVRDGLKFIDIADKLGMSRPQMARNYFEKVKEFFKQKYPDLEGV